ncbi:hypothetical protein DVA67_002870 [Solirubrobacter sp. CPCC 204708]|nr:hypothetical protein [Solirubrobacter deserti]
MLDISDDATYISKGSSAATSTTCLVAVGRARRVEGLSDTSPLPPRRPALRGDRL